MIYTLYRWLLIFTHTTLVETWQKSPFIFKMELELELGCCFIFKKVFLTLCFLISRKKAFAKKILKTFMVFNFFPKNRVKLVKFTLHKKKKIQNFPNFLV